MNGHALTMFPDTCEADWTQRNDAWIHKDAVVGEAAFLDGGVFRAGYFLGGIFYGGVFHGGIFRNGVFRGGTFHGGEFRGGWYNNGVFHGGYFYGGEFCGGTFHGGTFYGGVFAGGTFYNGTFRGGRYSAGAFHGAPPLFLGLLPWDITIGAPGMISIGCRCLAPEEWRQRAEELLYAEGLAHSEVAAYMHRGRPAVEALEHWLQSVGAEVVRPE